MREILCHPLGPWPWALGNVNGSKKKTNKAALAKHIESKYSPAEEIPRPDSHTFALCTLLYCAQRFAHRGIRSLTNQRDTVHIIINYNVAHFKDGGQNDICLSIKKVHHMDSDILDLKITENEIVHLIVSLVVTIH